MDLVGALYPGDTGSGNEYRFIRSGLGDNDYIINNVTGNSANIIGKPFTILVNYEE